MLNRVGGNLIVLAALRGQGRIPYWPPERLQELRDARVRETVRYAAETVPYWRDLFRDDGIDPSDIRNADDLARLPLLDKETVQEQPESFVSESGLGRTSIPFLTSGATGRRLVINHDRRSLLRNIAYNERQRAVEARLCGKRYGYSRLAVESPGGTGRRVAGVYGRNTFMPLRATHHFVSSQEPLTRVVAEINSRRPDVVRGHGSYLELLFRVVAERGVDIRLPRVLLYGGDMMTTAGRSFIEEHFGLPVLSSYNAAEAFQIGFLCEERRYFHLYADLTHVRVVDGAGADVPAGQEGEVVISNLVNRGTVLLNYRLGDRASLIDGRCACGRTLPMLSELQGRLLDIVVLPDGNLVTMGRIWEVVKRRPEVLRYQFVQVEPRRFELRLMTADRRVYDRIADELLRELRGVAGPACTVEASFHDSLEPGPDGKFRTLVALQPAGDTALAPLP
jgi:phenylacetate-CoA ligase